MIRGNFDSLLTQWWLPLMTCINTGFVSTNRQRRHFLWATSLSFWQTLWQNVRVIHFGHQWVRHHGNHGEFWRWRACKQTLSSPDKKPFSYIYDNSLSLSHKVVAKKSQKIDSHKSARFFFVCLCVTWGLVFSRSSLIASSFSFLASSSCIRLSRFNAMILRRSSSRRRRSLWRNLSRSLSSCNTILNWTVYFTISIEMQRIYTVYL